MRTYKQFLKDGIMLTFTMLILRTAGVFFSSRLAFRAGASVMGLYSQIMTVYAFAVTAASAGVNLGSLRIISESFGSDRVSEIRLALRECVSYCLKAGGIVSVLFFTLSPFLGGVVLGDIRTVSSLRTLASALPFIALSNVFHGYFNGVNKIYKSAAVNLIEQFIRISMTLGALSVIKTSDPELICRSLVFCNAFSEAFSCFVLFILYLFDRRRFPPVKGNGKPLRRRFVGITLPFACSALVRSGLTTAEHIFIPIGMRANGADSETALAGYGIVSGMVMPVLLYPMALLSAFASVSVSELSARISAGESKGILSRYISKGIGLSLTYAIGASAIIRYFSESLGITLYGNVQAGDLIRLMSPLIIFMYLDHISDGMLKGLDKQNYVMKVNIIDAALSVAFALILIPRFGLYGFVASVYLCEILNCICSFGMLTRCTGLSFDMLRYIALPALSSVIAVWLVSVLKSCFEIKYPQNIMSNTFVSIFFAVFFYAVLLILFGVILKKDNVSGRSAVTPCIDKH